MIVLIEHPQHGRMHVYSQLELDRHKAMGWTPVIEVVEKKENVIPIPIQKRTRGRPKR